MISKQDLFYNSIKIFISTLCSYLENKLISNPIWNLIILGLWSWYIKSVILTRPSMEPLTIYSLYVNIYGGVVNTFIKFVV